MARYATHIVSDMIGDVGDGDLHAQIKVEEITLLKLKM